MANTITPALLKGWFVISMKNDWKRVLSFDE
jgi:hypothetical protein